MTDRRALPGEVDAGTIIPERGVQISPWNFRCPYCSQRWARGGHKEGFVKSAANNHVAACWEICLFNAGYMFWRWLQSRGRTVAPIDEIVKHEGGKRNRRAVMALVRARKRAGLYPRKP